MTYQLAYDNGTGQQSGVDEDGAPVLFEDLDAAKFAAVEYLASLSQPVNDAVNPARDPAYASITITDDETLGEWRLDGATGAWTEAINYRAVAQAKQEEQQLADAERAADLQYEHGYAGNDSTDVNAANSATGAGAPSATGVNPVGSYATGTEAPEVDTGEFGSGGDRTQADQDVTWGEGGEPARGRDYGAPLGGGPDTDGDDGNAEEGTDDGATMGGVPVKKSRGEHGVGDNDENGENDDDNSSKVKNAAEVVKDVAEKAAKPGKHGKSKNDGNDDDSSSDE